MAFLVSCEDELFDELVGERTEEVAAEGELPDDTAEEENGDSEAEEEGDDEESEGEDSEGEETEEGDSDENTDDATENEEGSEGEEGHDDQEDSHDETGDNETDGDDGMDGNDGHDDETNDDQGNDNGQEDEAEENEADEEEAAADITEIKALIAEGIWKIRRYRQNNSFDDPRDYTDTTTDFDNYTFDFDENGTVEISINGSVVGQEWSLTEDNNGLVFSLHISSNDAALSTLDKEWRAASFSNTDFVVIVGERNSNTRTDNRIFLAFRKL